VKILLASSSSGSRGGGELYLLYLARALVDRGHEVTLWASDHPRMDELADSFARIGRVVRSSYRNTYDRRGRSLASFFDRRTGHRIGEEWRQLGVDVIHLNKQNLEDGLDLFVALRRSGVPSLCTIHLTQSARYLRAVMAWPRDFCARQVLRSYPGMLVTVLENRQRDLVEFMGSSPHIRMIPNGVPLFALEKRAEARTRRTELGIADDELLIVGVGRMVPQKRPLLFLEQAERILQAGVKARFLWIGEGTFRSLAEEWDRWVAEHRRADKIQRLPWQSDVGSFLLAADVFLHVAEFEGLPLAILEAMSAGLPCAITSNLLGEMPFLNSANSIAITEDDRCLAPLRHPEHLRENGKAARQLVEERFSFDTMAARYEAHYLEARGG
jgi:glycosyltransferase involved in cell wall biosynthesis